MSAPASLMIGAILVGLCVFGMLVYMFNVRRKALRWVGLTMMLAGGVPIAAMVLAGLMWIVANMLGARP